MLRRVLVLCLSYGAAPGEARVDERSTNPDTKPSTNPNSNSRRASDAPTNYDSDNDRSDDYNARRYEDTSARINTGADKDGEVIVGDDDSDDTGGIGYAIRSSYRTSNRNGALFGMNC